MKKGILFLGLMTMLVFNTLAQKKQETTYPYWTLKGVQKQRFKNVDYKPSALATGSNQHILSKDVHKKRMEEQKPTNKSISTTGTPNRVISKGVHRRR